MQHSGDRQTTFCVCLVFCFFVFLPTRLSWFSVLCVRSVFRVDINKATLTVKCRCCFFLLFCFVFSWTSLQHLEPEPIVSLLAPSLPYVWMVVGGRGFMFIGADFAWCLFLLSHFRGGVVFRLCSTCFHAFVLRRRRRTVFTAQTAGHNHADVKNV